MPLQADNYVQFFQGACAESHIAALFQFAGYEVNKVTPDAGIDLIVTNIARSRFNDEVSKSILVQVKSTVASGSNAKFWLSSDEMDFLCSGDERYTVFSVFHNLEAKLDEDHFDIYADQVQKMIDLDIEKFLENMARTTEEGKPRKQRILDFTKYSLTLFWLNSKQMNRAKNDDLWVFDSVLSKWYLKMSLEDNQLYLGHSMLMPALQEVRYMMLPCRSHESFVQGKFSFDHI